MSGASGSVTLEGMGLLVLEHDAQEIRCTRGGEVRRVRWDELTEVAIRTTDDGPIGDDLFWGLHAGDGPPRIVFPGGTDGEEALLAAMQARLPGFDSQAVIDAMGSVEHAEFVLWRRDAGRAVH